MKTKIFKSKHTPGPWFQAEQKTKPAGQMLIGIGNGACHVGYASVTRAMSPFEAEANARLMAAAPELLQALEIIRDSDGDKEDMREMAIAAIERMNGNPLYCGEDYRKAKRGAK